MIIDYLASLLDINDLVDYYGCTDLSATNFNSIATVDNGSCQYIPFPQDFKVYQNFPNPFNPVTQFPIDVNIESDVTLRIYNLSGSLVYEHSMKSMQPGSYHSNSPFKWNASEFSSGVYFYSFKSSTGENHYNKLMLIK